MAATAIKDRVFRQIRPDAKHNWINVTENDFDELLPIASKHAKASSLMKAQRAIFRTFSNGVNTARDDWVTDVSAMFLGEKVRWFLDEYGRYGSQSTSLGTKIKWSRNLKVKLRRGLVEQFDPGAIVPYAYRPYFKAVLYRSKLMIDELGQMPRFDTGGPMIATPAAGEFRAVATTSLCDFHFIGDTRVYPLFTVADGGRVDNITDWSLDQFKKHYQPGRGKKDRPITKEAIFHYVYGVLHDPVYREKYALNLKREFPRIPFFADFWQWADWGRALIDLHIGYESVAPFALARNDVPDEKARRAGLPPKALLRADKAAGRIVLDSETTLSGVPAEAWDYKLGNRSALEWVLDQHKEKTPRDPTIREKFNTYRFADYKEKVIDLLARVTTVSVQTMQIVGAMQRAAR